MIAWMLAAFVAASAHDVSGYPLGFCNGEYGTSSKVKVSGKDLEVSAAIGIPSEYARSVARNSIRSIRMASCSRLNVDSLTVWIRESLDGPDMAYGAIPISQFAQGWNEIPLQTTYEISEDSEGFFIGYTYHQTGKSGIISIVEPQNPGGLWVKEGDGEWNDRSTEGTLSIEGMVYGDYLPRLNAQLLSVTTDRYFIKSEGTLNGVVSVRNNATETIKELTISGDFGESGEPCSVTVECDIPYGVTSRVGFDMTPQINVSDGEIEGLFTITSINGKDDEFYGDNSSSATFIVVERAFRRTSLLEEFTTEGCPNCPRVAEYIHDILADPLYSSRLAVACHHSGYGKDFLTTPFDVEYEWFYNDGGGTYAPATMVDRIRHGERSPLFCPSSIDDLKNAIDRNLEEPAQIYLELTAEKESSANGDFVKVRVSGKRIDESVAQDGTVFLVENNVKSRRQSGKGPEYLHQHVSRQVNSTWGEPAEWNGDTIEYECELQLDGEWNPSELQCVAFVSDYDAEDVFGCIVHNAAVCGVGTSSANMHTQDSNCDTIIITGIDGIVRNGIEKGINIIIHSDGRVEKIIR